MFQEAADHWQRNLSDALSRTPQENLEKQTELLREGFEKAMANMRELAELASESQTEAVRIMRERFEENLARMQGGSGGRDKK